MPYPKQFCQCGAQIFPLYANVGGRDVRWKRIEFGFCFSCYKARKRRVANTPKGFSKWQKTKSVLIKKEKPE